MLLNIMRVHFLAFITCFSTGTLGSPEDLLPGSYNLQIPQSGRPAQPYRSLQNYNQDLTQSGAGASYTVPVSRHHIIPFNRLRAFYNAVVANGHLPRLSNFFDVYSNHLRFYAQSGGADCTAIGPDLIEAANLAQGQGRGWVNGLLGNRMAPGTDTFQEFYAWLPGNLFIGPNNRSDDPHEGFEVGAYSVVGGTAFDILERLNRDMGTYLTNNDSSLLEGINSRLRQLAMIKIVYPLNSTDWVREANGTYRLRRPQSNAASTKAPDLSEKEVMSASCDGLDPTFDVMQARMIITLFDD